MRAADAQPIGEEEAARLFLPWSLYGALLAVSGGPDSMAMLALAARAWAREGRPGRLEALTFDHGLRPESAGEAALVARFCRDRGVPHRTIVWERDGLPAGNLHAAARLARYAALIGAARAAGLPAVLTAHHADDQAETVLMRLARTAEPRALAGVEWMLDAPRGQPMIARPFLYVAKERLEATIEALSVPFADDPSNCDGTFERARIRAVMPAFAAVGLTRQRLTALARRMSGVAEEFDGRAALLLEDHARVGDSGRVDLATACMDGLAWGGEIMLAVVRRMILAAGGHVVAPRRSALDRVLNALADLHLSADEGQSLTLTLGGVRLSFDMGSGLSASREWGRAGPPDAAISSGAEIVWDGRFVVRAPSAIALGALVRAFGRSGRGNDAERVLPALFAGGRCVSVPPPLAAKAPDGASADLEIRCIVGERLLDLHIGGLYDRLRLASMLA